MMKNTRRTHRIALCLAVTLLLVSAQADETKKWAKLNGGYYLLHHLCDDEAHLSLLLMAKHTPENTAVFIKKISRIAKENLDTLDQFADADKQISFDKNPLPAIEREVRAAIADDKQHQLLFGTEDTRFVRALMESQVEASNYAEHLAQVLAEEEDNADRRKKLKVMAGEWQQIKEEALKRLGI